jgi:hypothetical protein
MRRMEFGRNMFWLPFVGDYRTFLTSIGILDLEKLAKLAP